MSVTPPPLLHDINQESLTLYRPLALASTPPPGDTERQDIAWALATLAARRDRYVLYHDYLHGDHRLTFATKGYREAFRALLAGLRCNICPRVVHALTDRLKIVGFEGQDVAGATTGPGTAADTRDDAAAAWELWQSARLDRAENRILTEAVATGDAYLMVWPDPDDETLPRFHPHSADSVALRYDTERPGRILLAAKLWPDGGRYRLNLYYPERVLRYRSGRDNPSGVPDAKAFALLPDEGEQGNPYGRVPFFHFAFDAGMGQLGRGELHDVIPLQDALNKELCDLIVASEFGAFRQKYAIGVSADEDDDAAVQLGISRLMTVANADVKLGEFSATDLRPYLDTINAFFVLAAQIKGIPLYTLTMSGTVPSGEALKTLESPLVARVEDTQTDFGDVWEDALAFGLRIAGTVEDAQIVALWQPAASRADGDQVALVAKKVQETALPVAQAWKELGYDEGEIAEFAKQNADERQAATQATAQAFNAGQL